MHMRPPAFAVDAVGTDGDHWAVRPLHAAAPWPEAPHFIHLCRPLGHAFSGLPQPERLKLKQKRFPS
eukprot:6459756-Amphidinium_carterae.1